MSLDLLRNFAEMQGGACVHTFSQAQAFKVAAAQQRTDPKHKKGSWNDQGKMYKMVLRGDSGQQEEMGGVCATLCAFWIGFHACQDRNNPFTRGRSVWDYLFTDGGLNLGAATNIVVEHHLSSGDQITHIENVLRKFGVARRTKRTTGAPISHVFVPLNAGTTFSCANEITQNYGYKLIQIKKALDGSGNGHMLCAWSEGQDVLFMDPNLGEFWFPSPRAFKAWLAVFWNNMYGKGNNYKSMRVHDFV